MTESPIIFYCKDCEKIVDADKIGRKYVYKCGICGTKNVAFGTEKSIKSFFRVKEEVKVPEKKEVPKKEEVKAAPEKKEDSKKEEVPKKEEK
jgi:hypothetical protein